MYHLLLQTIAATAVLFFAPRFIEGFIFEGNIYDLVVAGILLGALNTFIKPLLKLIFFPIRLLTLGLFTFVINAGILWAVDLSLPSLTIKGLTPLFLGTIFLSFASVFLRMIFKPNTRNE